MSLSRFSFDPLLPGAVLAVLVAAVLFCAALAVLLRVRRGVAGRMAAMALLLLALANPRLVSEQRQPLADVVLVALDASPSQVLAGRLPQSEQALDAVVAQLKRLENTQVQVVRVGGEEQTLLFAALQNALSEVPRNRLAGVILITDGQVHDVPADLGRGLGVPVHVLLAGRPGERDRRMVLKDSPAYAMVGQTARVSFVVEDSSPRPLTVTLRLNGEDVAEVPVTPGRVTQAEIPLSHGGPNVLELAAEQAEGELSLTNNSTAITINGVRDRMKVLLVSGHPHAGGRVWRNLLKSDPAVDLVHFTILRSRDSSGPTSDLSLIAFPVDELFSTKLNSFDLVVFDRFSPHTLLESAHYLNLSTYVRQGGALLMAAGPEYLQPGSLHETHIADILPTRPRGGVIEQSFRPRLTAQGRRHPVTATLPGAGEPAGGGEPRWGAWVRLIGAETQENRISLLSGPGEAPLLLLSRVQEGRVAALMSDSIWLWARGYDGGGPHAEMLRRVVHWLMKEPDLEEEALGASLRNGKLEVTRRSLLPTQAPVNVTFPDGSQRAVVPAEQSDGRGVARLDAPLPGLYRVQDGARTAFAATPGAAILEASELIATDRTLAPVAAATGGSVRWLESDPDPALRKVKSGQQAFGKGWMGVTARGQSAVSALHERSALPAALLAVLALAGLLWGWVRERS